MRKVSSLLRAIAYCLTFILLAFAAINWPTAKAAEWLPAVRYPLDAATLAVGGNIGSVAGVSAVTFNPAGLTRISVREAQATHLSPLISTTLDGFAIAVPVASGGWGVSVQHLNSADLKRTSDTGEIIGTFSYQESALAVSYARAIGTTAVGAALRGLWQAQGDSRNSGMEVIAGVQQALGERWSAGLVVAKAFTRSADAGNGGSVAAGASYLGPTYAIQAGWAAEAANLGGEWRILPELALRAGVVMRDNAASYRLGTGVALGNMTLDYAYMGGSAGEIPQQLALGHVVTVRFAF